MKTPILDVTKEPAMQEDDDTNDCKSPQVIDFMSIYSTIQVVARHASNKYRGIASSLRSPDALVNELWMKLERNPEVFRYSEEDRLRFLRVSTKNIILDRWRAKKTEKRGGGQVTNFSALDNPSAGRTSWIASLADPDTGARSSFLCDYFDFISAFEELENVHARPAMAWQFRFVMGMAFREVLAHCAAAGVIYESEKSVQLAVTRFNRMLVKKLKE